MKETIEKLDFNTMDEEGFNNLVTELETYNDDDLKESIDYILDNSVSMNENDEVNSFITKLFDVQSLKDRIDSMYSE